MKAERIETIQYIVKGVEKLSEKNALNEARHEFFKHFQRYPNILRVSPYSFNELKAASERYDHSIALDMQVEIERDWEDGKWLVCIEDSKTYAVN